MTSELGETPVQAASLTFGHTEGSQLLFHWSPRTRRKSIRRVGLKSGNLAPSKSWRPPYVAFATTPHLAWQLSGMVPWNSDIEWWDLWMTDFEHIGGAEMIPFDDGDPREYRVYYRIPMKDLFFIGTRHQIGEKHDG